MPLQFEKFYQDYLDKLAAYDLAATTIYQDQQTIAPKKGVPYSNEVLSILAKEQFDIANDPKTIEKLKEYQSRLEEGTLEKKELDMRLKDLADTQNIPSDVYAAYVKSKADGEMMWRQAKQTNDYELFKPYLKDLMEKTLELLPYSANYEKGKEYDLLLDQYEAGMNQEKYDAFFDVIKEELVPFLKKIDESGKKIDLSLMRKNQDVKKQEEFMDVVCDYLQVDPEKVYLSTTEHPFTNFLSANDARITTHYYPNRFLSAILSTVHEYGHALYGIQMNPDFYKTKLVENVGSAAHESQSRFLENHIGRTPEFWASLYPTLQAMFPDYKNVSLEELMEMINAIDSRLVRTEADELTYPLHILIRYELEKEIAKGNIDYDKLPKMWADKYEEYLGVRPERFDEGILQDVHWGCGYLGYFPTYALGSAYAAQLYTQMEKDLDVPAILENKEFSKIADWLKENVHHYANSKSMEEIVEIVSGKKFDPHIYTDYLKDKYSKLYNID